MPKMSISSRVLKKGFKAFTASMGGRFSYDRSAQEVFHDDLRKAAEWIDTFPLSPDFRGKRVLEVGCGYGALCVRALQGGAAEVLGVEIDEGAAEAAKKMVDRQFPELVSRASFAAYSELNGIDKRFDVILSQNAFEHYREPEEVLENMVAILKPGGCIYAGFGPLWNSPYGSHLGWVNPLPWAQLWAGDLLLKEHNRLRPHDPKADWSSLCLNRACLKRYEDMLKGLKGCEIIALKHNPTIKRRAPLVYYCLEPLRSVAVLKEYLTASLFVTIRKGTDAGGARLS